MFCHSRRGVPAELLNVSHWEIRRSSRRSAERVGFSQVEISTSRHQLTDDNYLGRLAAYTGRVREAGLPLRFEQISKVNGMPGKRIADRFALHRF